MQKVLIVTYYWPPGSGAGVQRWLKFSKYLPRHGWEPVILTIDPDYAAWPVTDDSLSGEIPDSLRVYKTKATDFFRLYNRDKTKIPSAGFAGDEKKGFSGKIIRFIRGNFFIPDPRRGWNKHAFRKACEIIESFGIKNVITTSPPHSTQLIGLRLRRKYPEINWIADLRDPWTDIYYYHKFYPTFITRAIDRRLEKKVLRSAGKIITVGRSLKELFSTKMPGLEQKTEVICNGYDEEDFSGIKGMRPEIFTISYIGTLSDAYPLDGFLKAVEILKEDMIPCKIRFVGLISPEQKHRIIGRAEEYYPDFIPYSGHSAAIRYMMNSSVLLLIIPDHATSRSIITGKLFEYMAAGVPVICFGPQDGDAAAILKETGLGKTFRYDDPQGASEYLEDLAFRGDNSKMPAPSKYSRERLAAEVAGLLK